MAFDVEGARKAGYSDAEIADHLAKSAQFDLSGAKKSGYTDSEVIAHLASSTELPAPKPGLIDQITGLPGRIAEAVTGAQRRMPETEALPDWAALPEFRAGTGGAQQGASPLAALKAALGSQLAGPEEAAQIVKSNFPNIGVRQDEKGNFIFKSGVDGKEYAMKPGFRASDIGRALFGVAAFTPAGRAATLPGMAAGSALTQAAIEASQAATGGEFNPGEVATAAALAPVVPAVASGLRAIAAPVRSGIQRALGRVEQAAPEAMPSAAAPAPAAQAAPAAEAAPVAQMAAPELAQTAKKAAGGGLGSGAASDELAAQVAPNAKTVAAAERLGIQDYLQPDHVTTSQAYRELAQAVKSIPSSQARAAELEGLEQVGQRAEKLIDDIGGTSDLSALDANVKTSLQKTRDKMAGQANALYDKVRGMVPEGAPAEAPDTIAFLRSHADELGGEANLAKASPVEARLLRNLGGEEPVTYAFLDTTRRQIGQALRKSTGPFKDSEEGLLRKLYSTLSEDQSRIVSGYGDNAFYAYKAAQYATTLQKGVEDDLISLFGKNIDGSLLGDLSGSVRVLAQGDSSRLIRLLKAVPDDMRQEVVASGLASAFRTAGTRGPISFGQYAKWYEGLLRNKQAYAAIMSNLPQASRKQLSDLYRVSRDISAATRERVTTGRIMAVKEELSAADNLASRMFDAAKRSTAGAAVGTAASTVVGPAAGAAIASALMKGAKPEAIKAVDALIASNEFMQAAKSAGTQAQGAAITKLARSQSFKKFIRATGAPRELSSQERWIAQSMQASNQQRQ